MPAFERPWRLNPLLKKAPKPELVGLYALLVAAAILIVRYQLSLLDWQLWGDEAETIVAAQMMVAGRRLYEEVFNHHGPLVFLPAMLVEQFGDVEVSAHRFIVVGLQWVALFSLYRSPLFRSPGQSVAAVLIAGTGMVVFLPELHGHTYTYQVIAGLLSAVILVQFSLPGALGIAVRPWVAGVGAFLCLSLPFLAVTYVPAALLFLAAGTRKPVLAGVAWGAGLGLALNLAFLLCFGSVTGYIAYHLYLNARFLFPDTNAWTLVVQVLSSTVDSPQGFLGMLVLATGAYFWQQRSPDRFPYRAVLLALGIVLFLVRGKSWDFQTLPFWYCLLAVFVPALSPLAPPDRTTPQNLRTVLLSLPFLAMGLLLLLKLALFFPGDREKLASSPIPVWSDFSEIARTVTTKDEPILALTFQNQEYILARRLPASAHFFYLPWQALYAGSPILGVGSSLRDDILRTRPKVIFADKWKVWDRDDLAWERYAADIDAVLNAEYRKMGSMPIYLRKDLEPRSFGLDPDTGLAANSREAAAAPAGELVKGGSVVQKLKPLEVDVFQGIALDLATYGRKNTGTLSVSMRDGAGQIVAEETLDLKSLADNRFRAIRFSTPVTGAKTKEYSLQISSDGSPGNAGTVWMEKNSDPRYDVLIDRIPRSGFSLLYRIIGAAEVP